MTDSFKEEALRFHRFPVPGKISIAPTKTLANQRDLSLAYSPGVAYACEEIKKDPLQADYLTSRANLVAVISNGTAVLGLGNIGALAGKPVMEGKGVLFKKFAGIDVFDIEVNETDPDKFIQIVESLEPTFGGINLEDIKAPECFEIETKLKEKMNIPVFHDDQHGTAIIASAAVINALKIQDKEISKVKIVASGAGAAGMSCLEMLVRLGADRKNIIVCDSKGPIYEGRPGELTGRKAAFVSQTSARNLEEAIEDADVFLGVSKAGLVSKKMVKSMAKNPLVLALANPEPEILPEDVHAVRDDAIVATGRSDYPNQVNNVLCFPYLFRGALDVGATTINTEMQLAAVYALAELAQSPAGEEVIAAYGGQRLSYGPEYVIPKPFDPRLITKVSVAVAEAAMKSGVAKRPITNLKEYEEKLATLFNKSGFLMKPIIDQARANPLKVVFAEGEEDRVLRAVVACIQEGICKPILIGDRKKIADKIKEFDMPIEIDKEFEVIEPTNNPYFDECYEKYQVIRGRDGIDPIEAKIQLHTRPTVLASMLVYLGYADTLICGTTGRYDRHLRRVSHILGVKEGMGKACALNVLMTPKGTVCIADTHIQREPDAKALTEITIAAAEAIRHLGFTPKVSLVSRSSFGECPDLRSSKEMRKALPMIKAQAPDLEVEGEMQADAALAEEVRRQVYPGNQLSGSANLMIMPNIDAANIAYNIMKVWADGNVVGPVLLGVNRPAQILTKVSTARRIINMAAIAVVEAQTYYEELNNRK